MRINIRNSLIMRVCHTKNSLELVNFANRHGGWHSYKPTKATIKALVRAKELGSVETNEFGQFRAKREDNKNSWSIGEMIAKDRIF